MDVLCEDEPPALHRMLTTSRLLLHVASRNGHEQIVWRLCGAGANANDTWIILDHPRQDFLWARRGFRCASKKCMNSGC